MKIFEVLEPRQQLTEESSGKTRYNSEIGMLLALCNVDPATFDPADPGNPKTGIPANLLEDPERVYTDIKKYLNRPNVYDLDRLTAWTAHGHRMIPVLARKLMSISKDKIQAYRWAGGKNINPDTSADIEFVGSPVAGISIKDDTGITLNNPSPKELGIANEGDMFLQYARNEYISWKEQTFSKVMELAQAKPGTHIGGKNPDKYYVMYDPKTKKFKCVGKSTLEGSDAEILAKVTINKDWQRGFGDWFVQNYKIPEVKEYMKPLQDAISEQFVTMMESHLSQSGKAAKLLKFAKTPFFYVNPSHMYYVPSIDDVTDLELKRVTPGNANGATIKFYAECGMKDSEENAQVEIHVRYANGVFEENPTARVQSLKNPQFISWEELV